MSVLQRFLEKDVPGYQWIDPRRCSYFDHGGVIALVRNDEVKRLRFRIPNDPYIKYFWSIKLSDVENTPGFLDSQREPILKQLIEFEGDKVRCLRKLNIRSIDQFQPNQYSRPALYYIYNNTTPEFRSQYSLIGGVEAANEFSGYINANFGIFGGSFDKEKDETIIDCALRELKEELYIYLNDTRRILDSQEQIRHWLNIPYLETELHFAGRMNTRRRNGESILKTIAMKSFILIFQPRDLILRP